MHAVIKICFGSGFNSITLCMFVLIALGSGTLDTKWQKNSEHILQNIVAYIIPVDLCAHSFQNRLSLDTYSRR
jgi:hypothetical protein